MILLMRQIYFHIVLMNSPSKMARYIYYFAIKEDNEF